MKNIMLIGLKYDKNIGDSIIGENLKWILDNNYNNLNINSCDLKARVNPNDKMSFFTRGCLHYFQKIKSRKIKFFLCEFAFCLGENRKIKKYYYKKLNSIDMCIFAGGGIIECEHYYSYHYIKLITKICEKKNIEIIYNAVGFNGTYNPNYKGYIILKRALNSRCVSHISVRENINEILKYGIQNATLVCDPGCFSNFTYNIFRKKTNTIGISVVRPNIFSEFGFHMDEFTLINFYHELIIRLQNNKYDYQFFTNGDDSDGYFIKKIFEKFSDIKNKSILVPKSGEELINILSNFRVIVCSRMHASICSYSLNIPSINLCWNEKIFFFYENIDYKNRIFMPPFDVLKVYNKVLELYDNDCNNEKRGKYLNSIIDFYNGIFK